MPLTLLGAGLLVVGCVGRRRILNARRRLSTSAPRVSDENHRYIRHVAVRSGRRARGRQHRPLTRGGNAHGDTIAGTLVGEGGDAMTPVMLSILKDDSSQLDPDTASYTNVNLDQAISDFVGTGPGSFAADFAVSERPLTAAETASATTDGRSYAYVPFAATPVALMTLVPLSSYTLGQPGYRSERLLPAHPAEPDPARRDLRKPHGHELGRPVVLRLLHRDDDDNHRRVDHDNHHSRPRRPASTRCPLRSTATEIRPWRTRP